ncbi:hypothetical protein HWV62_21516 [Athelia sp. TMB]|nr:hypothetical protein HWV62_21516 [Athelia sp. TMB]
MPLGAVLASELAAAFPHAHFLRVDVDKQPAIAAKYKISAMPTFLAIIDGEVKGTVWFSACPQNLADDDWKSYKVQIAKGSRNSSLKTLDHHCLASLLLRKRQRKKEMLELFKAEKWDDACIKYTVAIDAAPTSAVLYANRSAALLKAAKVDEAIADGRKATELDEKWGKGWYRLAEALEAQTPPDKYQIADAYRSQIYLLNKDQ